MALRMWTDMIEELLVKSSNLTSRFTTTAEALRKVQDTKLAALEQCAVCHARFEAKLELCHILAQERGLLRGLATSSGCL